MSTLGHNGGLDDEEDRAGNWFAVSRNIFDHPIIGIHNRPFTETEAWLWLIASASYETRKVMNKGAVIILDPGDLMAAHGYLATRWMWTIDKVRWWLNKLAREAMITRATQKCANRYTNQIQIITLSNYSRFQITKEAQRQADSQANTKPTPSQHQESNTITTKQKNKDIPPNPLGGDARAERGRINRETAKQVFGEFQALMRRLGLPVPRDTSFETFGKKIAERLHQHAELPKGREQMLAVWVLAASMIERSQFLRGQTNTAFRADLKWFCQRESFDKLISGGFGNGACAPQSTLLKPQPQKRQMTADELYEHRMKLLLEDGTIDRKTYDNR